MNQKTVTLNNEQRLYVIPCGEGFTCLGFDVCDKRAVALARELAALGESIPQPAAVGSLERHQQLEAFYAVARKHNTATGWRSQSELTPELIGYEHRRVEVRHCWPEGAIEVLRFIVGKSTGVVPCHLKIAKRGSSGGPAVMLGRILSVRAA